MKLTETQKKFREQMKEINEKNTSIYTNPRKGNPFHNQKVSGIGVFFIIVILIFTFQSLRNRSIPSSSTQLVPVSSSTVQGAIPRKYVKDLTQADTYLQEINKITKSLRVFHKQPEQQRDMGQYQKLLIELIAACNKIQSELQNNESTEMFGSLYPILKETTFNLGYSLKYYLDASSSGNNSDIEMGNYYMKLTNNYLNQYKNRLIQILNENKFKYEILENGNIQYWVNER